jgi:hypothetical protein
MVTDSYSNLARWRHHFCQLLNVHAINDVRQTEKYTAEPLVPEPSAFEFEMTNEKIKRHKSLGTDQIPELIQAGGRTIRSQIHELINTTWNNEILPEEWKE